MRRFPPVIGCAEVVSEDSAELGRFRAIDDKWDADGTVDFGLHRSMYCWSLPPLFGCNLDIDIAKHVTSLGILPLASLVEVLACLAFGLCLFLATSFSRDTMSAFEALGNGDFTSLSVGLSTLVINSVPSLGECVIDLFDMTTRWAFLVKGKRRIKWADKFNVFGVCRVEFDNAWGVGRTRLLLVRLSSLGVVTP
jgi:hypothetical protein